MILNLSSIDYTLEFSGIRVTSVWRALAYSKLLEADGDANQYGDATEHHYDPDVMVESLATAGWTK